VVSLALLAAFSATARAQLLPNCEFPPVDEPDGDGDECFAPLDPDQIPKTLGPGTPDTNGPPCDDTEPGQNPAGGDCADPVSLTTGNNFRQERDYTAAGAFPLAFTRGYNSLAASVGSVGANWTHSYAARIVQVSASTVQAIRPEGKVLTFQLTASGWTPDLDVNARLAASLDGSGTVTGWQLTNGRDGAETYASDGTLLRVANRAGLAHTLTYDPQGHLATVHDSFGRALSFASDAAGRITKMTDPAGGTYVYAYDGSNNLASVTYPDGTQRTYLYENSAFPNAMTGLIDENGTRLAAWTYDGQGLAISSLLAGGVQQHSFSYDFVNGSTTDTDGLGRSRTYDYLTAASTERTLHEHRVLPTGTAIDSRIYDNNGNIVQYIDFRGTTTNYTFDPVRNLETSRTEAVGTPQERTIATTWHPSFRLPVQIVEPNRTTTFAYDANGNLLTRTVSGVNASDRTTAYQYDANGLLTQFDGPRADVADVIQLAHDGQGNLSQITDALGHATKIVASDANGRPLSIVDANGLRTLLTYDARGRLLSRKRGRELTTYAYDAAGQLLTQTFPDGTFVSYQHDPAHQLTGVQDTLGNRVGYTLDVMGNVLESDLFDPAGNLTRAHKRVYDSVDRVAQSIGATGQTTTLSYDANNNMTGVLDPSNGFSSVVYDALNRPSLESNPLAETAADALDSHDDLTALTDPLGNITSYIRDGLGNAVTTNSPDRGTIQNAFDGATDVINRVDARGQSSSYSYDALDRLSTLDFSGGSMAFTYDQGCNGVGHLTQMADTAATTTFNYDDQGRLSRRAQTIGHHTLAVSYQRDAHGRLTGMTYPSGLQVGFVYTNGLVTTVTANGKPVMTGIAYQPFGAPTSWTWGNGLAYSRQFDQDGRLVSYDLGGGRSRALSYDPSGRITAYTDSLASQSQTFAYSSIGQLVAASGGGAADTSYTYDANGNRLTATTAGQTATYAYAAGSSRLASVDSTSAQVFSYDAAGNVVGDGTNQFAFDGLGRLTQVTTGNGATFQYLFNGFGQRIAKLKNVTDTTDDDCDDDGDDDGGAAAKVSRYFAYDEAGHLVSEVTGKGRAIEETIYLGDLPVATVSAGKKLSFVYADHLNAPRAIANASGAVVWRWEGDPFGATQPNEDADGNGRAFVYNLRFPGQYFDRETALHHNGSRFYSPPLGRYIQADTTGINGGPNLYAYVGGNPVGLKDPTGEPNPLELACIFGPNPVCDIGVIVEIPTWVYTAMVASGALVTASAAVEADTQPQQIPQFVVRGGTCTREQFVNGKGVVVDEKGFLQGVSVQTWPDTSVQDLSQRQWIKNNQIGVTTLDKLLAAGATVDPTPRDYNPYHADLGNITPEIAVILFNPPIPNPNPKVSP
jgi:RHS repeat-associated protein